MVANAKANTGLPVYAVVGGTHLYFTKVESGFLRAVMGSTRLFARRNTRTDVEDVVDMLQQQGVEKVYISGHDADQASLDIFDQDMAAVTR